MKLKLKLLTETAKVPTKAHDTDACFDLYSDRTIEEINPGETVMVPTGIATEIPRGHYAAVYARSGLGIKHNLRPANCVGVIDSDYRGEWMVGLHNDGKIVKSIKQGERIAQFIIQEVLPIEIEQVEELSDTERGEGGFGSSGKE